MDSKSLVEKIGIGVVAVSAPCFVVSALIALENSFEIIDDYKKELARISKTSKESE